VAREVRGASPAGLAGIGGARACHNSDVTARRPRRRAPARRAAGLGLALVVTTGCVGQPSRNDDHVGPTSYRPDAREHTLGPTTTGVRPPLKAPA
jgi:hypothetical protein